MLHVSVNQPRNEKNTTTFPPYKLPLFNNLPKPTGVQLNIIIRSTESTMNSNSQYLFLPTPLLLSRPLGWYLISCLGSWEMNQCVEKIWGLQFFSCFGFCIRKWWKCKVPGMLKGLRWYLEFLFAYSLPGLNCQAKRGKLAVKVLGTGADLRQSSDSESTWTCPYNLFCSVQVSSHVVHGKPLTLNHTMLHLQVAWRVVVNSRTILTRFTHNYLTIHVNYITTFSKYP